LRWPRTGFERDRSRGYTLFAAAFAPGLPQRYPRNSVVDQMNSPSSPAHTVGLIDSEDGVVTEVMEDGKSDGHCEEIELEGDYGSAGSQISRTLDKYAHSVSEQAARGCAPADFACVRFADPRLGCGQRPLVARVRTGFERGETLTGLSLSDSTATMVWAEGDRGTTAGSAGR
jgi:hypothetical protein